MPVSFYPDYRSLGAKQNLNYGFKMVLTVGSKLSYTSIPANTTMKYVAKKQESIITTTKPGRELIYYFKTVDDLAPKLVYGKLDRLACHPLKGGKNQVALNVSMLPTFGEEAAQADHMIIERDMTPKYKQLSRGEDFLFVFIVDRSGSMQHQNRILTVVEAIKIFLRSLPQGSTFSIISFGSNYDLMKIDGVDKIKADQKNIKNAMEQLDKFEADYGGTCMLEPVQRAIKMEWAGQKRIFVLTDGQIENKPLVIEAAKGTSDMRVHTFGIGDHCDSDLVTRLAAAGRGAAELIGDDKSHLISARVIVTLERDFEPSYNNCRLIISHGGKENTEILGEVHRNELIYRSFFMPEDELATFRMEFTYHDEAGKAKTLFMDYGKLQQADSESLHEALYKMAAHSEITQLRSEKDKVKDIEAVSMKYQVLVDETAMVGVIEQNDPVTGELKKYELDAAKEN